MPASHPHRIGRSDVSTEAKVDQGNIVEGRPGTDRDPGGIGDAGFDEVQPGSEEFSRRFREDRRWGMDPVGDLLASLNLWEPWLRPVLTQSDTCCLVSLTHRFGCQRDRKSFPADSGRPADGEWILRVICWPP